MTKYEVRMTNWLKAAGLNFLPLKSMEKNRRGAKYGFPLKLESSMAKRLTDEGLPVVSSGRRGDIWES